MACLKLTPSPASALWFERKSISSLSSWMLHRLCLVSVGAVSCLGWDGPCGGLSEAAWVGLLLLQQVCMGCDKQLTQSHCSLMSHFGPFLSEEKKILLSNRSGPYKLVRSETWHILGTATLIWSCHQPQSKRIDEVATVPPDHSRKDKTKFE